MTFQPVPEAALIEIIDDIFLPLVRDGTATLSAARKS